MPALFAQLFRRTPGIVLGVLVAANAISAFGQTATLASSAPSIAATAGQLTLTASIDYSSKAAPTALAYSITLPAGWTMVSVGGRDQPSIIPATGSTGVLEFLYFSFPSGSASFSVVVAYPPGLSGSQTITATALYRTPLTSLSVTPLVIAGPTAPLAIASQPTGQTVTVGQPLSLTVSATGGSGALTYQWRKGGVNIAGATGAVFKINAVQTTDAGNYDVVVSSGASSVPSASATVVVMAQSSVPTITNQPQSVAVPVGTQAMLSVSASGTGPLSYQWRKNGVAFPGATSATLSISTATVADAGNYSVAVSNASGSTISSSAALSVVSAPAIAVQPLSMTVAPGAAASLSVVASGSAPLSYQWKKNGITIAGATSPSLSLNSAAGGDAGSYVAVVTNAAGSVTSSAAVVTVRTRALAGTYFGTMGGSGGTFALYVREDLTGVFIGYASGAKVALIGREVSLDSAGAFQISVNPGASPASLPGEPARAAADATYAVAGRIGSDGTLTGTVSGLNLTLSAPSAISGATSSLAGFYQAGAAGSGATAYAIMGAAGEAFMVSVNGALVDAGRGSVSSAGVVSITTGSNASVSGNVSSGAVSLTASSSGSKITFVGGNAEVRIDDEKLLNLSSRSQTGVGGQVLIAGFVIAGTEPKQVLVRAIGPALSAFGISGALSAARLELFNDRNVSLKVGLDWSQAVDSAALADAAARVGAFPLAKGSRDAAVLVTLAPGAYTAVVTGQGGATGVCLVEAYDATAGAIPKAQRMINISSRALVGSGESSLIGGFVISGSVPKRVLIRGVGPGLAQFGVPQTLARPQVILQQNGRSGVVAQNSGYAGTASAAAINAAAAAVGAFPLPAGSADAAILINLDPGAYTAQVLGVSGSTGNALVEVYEVP